jgi:hypothetical protein
MAIATRQQLTEYALRALGEPVVEINVDDSQLEDRIDEALDYWHQYHFDGAEKFYLKQKITASKLYLDNTNSAAFSPGTIITGQTSGAKATVCAEFGSTASNNIIFVKNVTIVDDTTKQDHAHADTLEPAFEAGETITGNNGATSVLDDPLACELGTYDKRYFELPDYIYGVTRVMPFSHASSSKNLFDLQYQLRLNDLYDLTSTSIIYYKTVMSHISLLNLELNGYPLYRFNRMMGRMTLDVNWDSSFAIGDFVLVECYRALDPTTFSNVWNEQWFKRYVTALFKRQWAVNIKKFSGIQLPGGVTIDGDKLYLEAISEIKELHDEMINKSAPLEFFLG